MEQLSIPITSAVVLVMRCSVVSRSSADPMARLMARRAATSAVVRLGEFCATSAMDLPPTACLAGRVGDLRADANAFAPEVSLVDLQRVAGRFRCVVELER